MTMRALLFLGLAAAGALAAQDTTQVAPGDSVRLLAPARGRWEWQAAFVAVRGDTALFRGAGPDSALVAVPLADIVRLDVNHGNRPPGNLAGPGMALGAIGGCVTGVLAAAFIDCGSNCTKERAGTVLLGTAVGAVIGLLDGASMQVDRYQRVWLRPQVSAPAAPGTALRIGVSVAVSP